MCKDRLTVARLILNKTISEMKALESLPQFSDMTYTDIERNLHIVISQVSGKGESSSRPIEDLDSSILPIIQSAKEEVSGRVDDFTSEDWSQVYSLACELINQATLQVRQK